MSEEVFETPITKEKPKRKRKPMSDSKKKALTERLAAGRAKKKALKNQKVLEKPNITMEVETVKEVEPKVIEPKVIEPKVIEPKTDNSLEMKALQDQINAMKLEKLEALEKKNEKKKAAIEKRRATINRKALEKAKKNEVAKPAKIRDPTPKAEIKAQTSMPMELDEDLFKPKKPRYSTFKKSVWSLL